MLNFQLLIHDNFLHLIKLILAVANPPLQKLGLLVQLPDVLFKTLIVLL